MTTASDFGAALTGLLSESARPKKRKSAAAEEEGGEKEGEGRKKKKTAAPILALSAKRLPPSMAEERLERRAARALKAEREERLDRARIRDVLEGWVPADGAGVGSQEFERGLRKTAQRGGEWPSTELHSPDLQGRGGKEVNTSHQVVQRHPRRVQERRGAGDNPRAEGGCQTRGG